jgi:autotransporter strand-loop-strand O-heptosyltransferase
MTKVLIRMLTKALGDTLGAVPYFEQKRISTGDDIYVSCQFHDLLQPVYPHLHFLPFGLRNSPIFSQCFDLDFEFDKPLQQGFCNQLGLEFSEIRPKIHVESSSRPFADRYVCFGMQSTSQNKYWNNPGGWEEICKRLRKENILPVCIDRDSSFGIEGNFNQIPPSAENKTGMSLPEVIKFLNHAEFFIGLSSGLSWLAHAVGKHVVMISGTTHSWCEFTQDVTRIQNQSVCHGCFNEPEKTPFDAGDWMWCPYHKSTDRQFECSKSIAPDLAWNKIRPLLCK